MSEGDAFTLVDCSLVRCATGQRCFNLRELLEAIRGASDSVIEHHMMRCALEDPFELYEFPNDLARWCWDALGEKVLGEELALVDPYKHSSIAAVRTTLVNAIEGRLWTTDLVPWCRPGLELHLLESRLVAYDTGEHFSTPAALAEGIEQMTLRSLYFHVHEARRRTGGQTDDFSAWLERRGAYSALVARLRAIDFYFLNLGQLRQELLDAFGQSLGHAPPLETAVLKEVAL